MEGVATAGQHGGLEELLHGGEGPRAGVEGEGGEQRGEERKHAGDLSARVVIATRVEELAEKETRFGGGVEGRIAVPQNHLGNGGETENSKREHKTHTRSDP